MTALLAFGKSVYRPAHLCRLLHDAADRSYRLEPDRVHLRAAVDWLARGQDICRQGAVSGGYSLPDACWRAAELGATSHAISAFLSAGRFLEDPALVDRALRAGKWIMGHFPDTFGGAAVGHHDLLPATVLMSWLELFEETGTAQFLAAAQNAGSAVVGQATQQDTAGRTDMLAQRQRALSAAAQLRLFGHTGAAELRRSAEQLIDQLISTSRPNGWPASHLNEATACRAPAYQLGMILAALFDCLPYLGGLRRERTELLLLTAAEKTMVRFELNKPRPELKPPFLPATFDSRWKSAGRFSCNTGTAYLADVWLKAFQRCRDGRFVNTALKAIDHLKVQQCLRSRVAGIAGAVTGARPCWSAAFTASLPTRATARTVIAMARQEEIMQEVAAL